MSRTELDNLVRVGSLKSEPPDQREFDSLLQSGRRRLHDATNDGLSFESRFDLAYNAARQRFIVFQSLVHTLALTPETGRILDKAHRTRNLAEYEGVLDVDERLLAELLAAGKAVQAGVERLGPVASDHTG